MEELEGLVLNEVEEPKEHVNSHTAEAIGTLWLS